MNFSTPCFICIENKQERIDLIKWLQSIGYKMFFHNDTEKTMIVLGVGISYCLDICDPCEEIINRLSYYGIYDCGTNVDLFKALAAITPYNDREQWFTDGQNWILCHDAVVTKMVIPSYAFYHKATAPEIIKHFKK